MASNDKVTKGHFPRGQPQGWEGGADGESVHRYDHTEQQSLRDDNGFGGSKVLQIPHLSWYS